MKTGRLFEFLLLLGLAPVIAHPAKRPPVSMSRLTTILARQGFTGILKGDVHFGNLGIFACGSNRYQVFYYEW